MTAPASLRPAATPGTTEQPLVSVVTPVYNGALYLEECIESVLAQTYANWEYVISDNASTDRSLELARAYAARDERIRVDAHEEHLGHLASWNRAVRSSSPASVYVKVVHADDALFPECLERMTAVAAATPSVGLVGAYRLDEDRVDLDGLPRGREVFPGREICRSALLGGPWPYVFGSPTSTLIRADLIRRLDPLYFEGNIHADAEACFALLAESDFGFVHQVLTYTRRHNEAVTAYTRRVGTYVPEEVTSFLRWGPTFLERDEYERKLVVRVVGYGAFLLRHAARLTDPEFRSFHRRKLREIAAEVTLPQLRRGAIAQVRRTLRRGR